MDDEAYDIILENICTALMILEIAEKNLEAFSKKPEAIVEINKLKILAKEAMEELSEEEMNKLLEVYKVKKDEMDERIKNENKK
ncbi:MAG: hypothetical protein WCL51_18305 [Bacteroidota bacterium]